jgi:glycosyltransferase involved in cell wall biosynthesis
MRILMVTSSYPFHPRDYHAWFLHDMAQALTEHGGMVMVVTPATPETEAPEAIWDNVRVQRFGYTRGVWATGGSGILENLKRHPLALGSLPTLFGAMVRSVRRAIREWNPELIIAHWLVPGGLAVACSGVAVRTIHFAHSSDVHLLGRIPFGRRISDTIHRQGRILATSPWLADRMRALGLAAPDGVVPMGIRNIATKPALPRSPLKICALGRMLPGKGLDMAVDALKACQETIHFSIAGDGPEKSHLVKQVQSLALQDRVTFHPPVIGPAQKQAFFQQHEAILFAGRPGHFQDNLPISVLEAMGEGLYPISTRVGGLPALGGLLVDSRPESIRATLDEVATSSIETRTDWANAALRQARLYAWPNVMKQLGRWLGGASSELAGGAAPA